MRDVVPAAGGEEQSKSYSQKEQKIKNKIKYYMKKEK